MHLFVFLAYLLGVVSMLIHTTKSRRNLRLVSSCLILVLEHQPWFRFRLFSIPGPFIPFSRGPTITVRFRIATM